MKLDIRSSPEGRSVTRLITSYSAQPQDRDPTEAGTNAFTAVAIGFALDYLVNDRRRAAVIWLTARSRGLPWIALTVSALALAGYGGSEDQSRRAASDSETVKSATTSIASTDAPPALRGRIIFTRAGGAYGDETIFVANADGTNERRLTKFGVNCCPRMTRDGTRILFAAPGADGRVTTATMAPDGTRYKKIRLRDKTINLGPGAWSPDGKRIAFQVWDERKHGRDGIYIGSADGRNLTRVTKAKVGADIPGDYSPDGKRIAFFRERADIQGVGSVWVVNVDGTDLRRLTPPKMLAGWGTVRWSPNGGKILLQSARTEPVGALWTVNLNGSNLRRVFADRKGRFAITPTWSPSSKKIMFALDPVADDYSHPVNGLYVINADGSGLRLVIASRDFKREPEWVR